MRVALDTNVLVSVLIFQSPTLRKALEIALSPGNRLIHSSFVVQETRDVIRRKWPSRLEAFEAYLRDLTFEAVTTPEHLPPDLIYIRDPNDYPVLYSALLGKANVLVTGDYDFIGIQVPGLEILAPAEFVARYTSA